MYPISQVFDWDKWQDDFDKHWRGDDHASRAPVPGEHDGGGGCATARQPRLS